MASIRRTLSPVPRAGTLLNGEACAVASPLSKSSSCTQNFMQPSGGYLFSLFGSLDSHLVQRSYRPQERSKLKGQIWRRAICHFFICFVVGVFVGLTPVVSLMGLSMNMMPKHQAFSFEVITPAGNFQLHDLISKNATPVVDSSGMKSNATILEPHAIKLEVKDENYYDPHVTEAPVDNSSIVYQKLLIIVTPTYARPFQAYYLSRLAHTLKLVPPPVLWIVVEMASESAETADMLMRTGVIYRHLVCKKNLTEINDGRVHQRNVALSHIETHRLDGIVYFADDDNIYSVDLFEQMRQIRRFGTWMVAKQMESKMKTIVEGPVCNGTQVVGWHTNEMARRFRRFHAELSGFAFNSTILWDPKRWHRPTVEPIRQLDTVREGFQVTTFIERLVEDESQMEGLPGDCLRITVWNLQLESSYSFYPQEWFMKNDLDVIYTLS